MMAMITTMMKVLLNNLMQFCTSKINSTQSFMNRPGLDQNNNQPNNTTKKQFEQNYKTAWDKWIVFTVFADFGMHPTEEKK